MRDLLRGIVLRGIGTRLTPGAARGSGQEGECHAVAPVRRARNV